MVLCLMLMSPVVLVAMAGSNEFLCGQALMHRSRNLTTREAPFPSGFSEREFQFDGSENINQLFLFLDSRVHALERELAKKKFDERAYIRTLHAVVEASDRWWRARRLSGGRYSGHYYTVKDLYELRVGDLNERMAKRLSGKALSHDLGLELLAIKNLDNPPWLISLGIGNLLARHPAFVRLELTSRELGELLEDSVRIRGVNIAMFRENIRFWAAFERDFRDWIEAARPRRIQILREIATILASGFLEIPSGELNHYELRFIAEIAALIPPEGPLPSDSSPPEPASERLVLNRHAEQLQRSYPAAFDKLQSAFAR
jgi:hypothetical protein